MIGYAARSFLHSTLLAVQAAHLQGTGGIRSEKRENLLEVTCVGLSGIWRTGSCRQARPSAPPLEQRWNVKSSANPVLPHSEALVRWPLGKVVRGSVLENVLGR